MASGIQIRLDEVESRLEVAEAELMAASSLVHSIHEDMAEVIQFIRFVKAGGKVAGVVYRTGKAMYYIGKVALIFSIPLGILMAWANDWGAKLADVFKVFR